ncbi:hypothetical protein [Massilia phyllosphaerae]|uniref:hypothetical protein n=1 Tax=Massilia phyllosphaerae TaxID=3106034 RepID=UPI002B1CAC39|nr:hypothetical protein [Massilia sp. SGZ-792]
MSIIEHSFRLFGTADGQLKVQGSHAKICDLKQAPAGAGRSGHNDSERIRFELYDDAARFGKITSETHYRIA